MPEEPQWVFVCPKCKVWWFDLYTSEGKECPVCKRETKTGARSGTRSATRLKGGYRQTSRRSVFGLLGRDLIFFLLGTLSLGVCWLGVLLGGRIR